MKQWIEDAANKAADRIVKMLEQGAPNCQIGHFVLEDLIAEEVERAVPSGWIDVGVRRPKREDANRYGYVWCRCVDTELKAREVWVPVDSALFRTDITHFLPITPFDREPTFPSLANWIDSKKQQWRKEHWADGAMPPDENTLVMWGMEYANLLAQEKAKNAAPHAPVT